MQQNFSLQDLVDEVDSRPVRTSGKRRVVVAGEFESGKSTVINALLRMPVLPCNPGMLARPKITVTNGSKPKITVDDTNGRRFVVSSFNEILENRSVETCLFQFPMSHYQGIDFIEIPYRHESGITAKHRSLMIDADLIIWVTIASQAWRLSEKTIIEKLPHHTREKSVLAISRADKLHNAEDFDKIENRLQNDASMFFSEIVFMQASTAMLKRAIHNDQDWHETGGGALAGIMRDHLGQPVQNRQKVAG